MRRRGADRGTGRGLLHCYPAVWRARYGEELVALMADQAEGSRLSWSTRADVARRGLGERARQSGLVSDSRPPEERVRAGALFVLCAWTVFVLGGAGFQKVTEHFQAAVPGGSRALPQAAFATVVAAAAAASALVIAGAVLALPAFVRYLRAGGWPMIRARVTTAVVATLIEAAALAALASWAHSLSEAQRNGGSPSYTGLFALAAVGGALTLALWTSVAVRGARRVDLSRRLLVVEAELALGLGLLMAIMTIAAAWWWGSVASSAPWFLQGSPRGRAASAFDPKLLGSMLLMTLALASAAYGTQRIVSGRRALRAA